MTVFSELKTRFRKWKLNRRSPSQVFDAYYRNNKWGDPDSRSGKGSNLTSTKDLRAKLPPLLHELGVKTMLDLPCGDFFWMQHVELAGIHYTGGDIVPGLIDGNTRNFASPMRQFAVIDLISGPIPQNDLIFTRDCLVHLSSSHVKAALRNIKASGSNWLLTTTYPGISENTEIATGEWRALDLTLAPFNLGKPLQVIEEGQGHVRGQDPNKMLGLWRIADLPDV